MSPATLQASEHLSFTENTVASCEVYYKEKMQWRNAARLGWPLRAKEHGRGVGIQRNKKEEY